MHRIPFGEPVSTACINKGTRCLAYASHVPTLCVLGCPFQTCMGVIKKVILKPSAASPPAVGLTFTSMPNEPDVWGRIYGFCRIIPADNRVIDTDNREHSDSVCANNDSRHERPSVPVFQTEVYFRWNGFVQRSRLHKGHVLDQSVYRYSLCFQRSKFCRL
jgi:hypothetical protein